MKRRSVFGLIAGGMAAAPAMAKEAVAKAAGVQITGLSSGLYGGMGDSQPSSAQSSFGTMKWAAERMAELATGGRRFDEIRKQSRVVSSLDPDLASMRSISMSRLISLQADRNFQRMMDSEKSWIESALFNH